VSLPGVFVAYQNPGHISNIYQATRLASCLQLSSDFIGIQSQVFMRFDGCQFTPQASQNRCVHKPINLKANFSARILLIRPYPGMDYTQFKLDQIDAVLHDLYHSGTACISDLFGQKYNLLAFIKQCQERQVPVYLAPALQSENSYSSTRELLSLGVQIIWNMSLEAAYAKLLLAYGNYADTEVIVDFLNANIAGEQI
jgi:L-asparaginase